MYKKLVLSIIGILILFSEGLTAQELRCNVQVISEQVQGTNKQIFTTLEKALYEFMNNRSWTNNVFTPEERIECNIMINVKEYSTPTLKGTLQLQARRPVYNSSYNTVLINYLDQNIEFDYVEFQALDFSESSFTTNITSLMAFYAYIILGLDYDSFALKGGTENLKKAEKVVTNAQNASQKGWKSYDASSNKNRYWLIQNMLDDKYSALRMFYYKFHRLGLDRMAEKTNEARADMANDLKLLQDVYRNKPDPYMHLLQVVLDAKSDEFVNIFTESPSEEKARVAKILKEVDPSNISKYQNLK